MTDTLSLLHESIDVIRALLAETDNERSEPNVRARLHLKELGRAVVRQCDAALPKAKRLAVAEGAFMRGGGRAVNRARYRQLVAIKDSAKRATEARHVSH